MNELDAIDNWIHDKLVTDTVAAGIATGGFYNSAFPQAPTRPGVLYQLQADTDFQGLGTVRLLARPLYLIRAVCAGHPTRDVRQLADRIDELFGKAVTNAAISWANDAFLVSGRRTAAVQYVERDPATERIYFHIGGLYRFDVSSLNRKAIELSDDVTTEVS